MKGSRRHSHFCFLVHKITPRHLPSNTSSNFRWWILIMASLILIILVIIPGVWSGEWGVALSSLCALKGTSVVIRCSYDYPSHHYVRSVSWSKYLFISGQWRRLSPQSDHFKYVGNYDHDCSLQINNVQPADEGWYRFSFVTSHNRWTSKTSALLSVRELTAVIQPSTVTEGGNVSLTCESGCRPSPNTVWLKDGQHVLNLVFQARSEDAGRYSCAVLGEERASSAPVTLNVQYAPRNVTLSVSPSDVVEGGSVTFTCSSDANPPVTPSGLGLFKDGRFIGSWQNFTISDVQLAHGGLYHCQASNNISRRGNDLINSTELQLDVQYGPMNISISMDPAGDGVNLTCNSLANPAADNYTWYKMAASAGAMLQVGSGQVLSIPAMEASHAGLYMCRARNRWGENNSTEMLLPFKAKQDGSSSLPILAGTGVCLIVMLLVLTLILLRRKQKIRAERKKQPADLKDLSSSAAEDQFNSIYANIHPMPTSPPPVTDVAPSQHEHDDCTFNEDDVTYTTVTIKPKNPNDSRDMQDSWSKAGEQDDSVIYATVAKST